MTLSEQKLMEFIATRLESMLRAPELWGSNLSVEEQVLQLLEMRRLLIDPEADMSGRRPSMKAYLRFLAKVVPTGTSEPLAVRLAAQGREGEFASLLKRYVEIEIADWLAPSTREEEPQASSPDLEKLRRLIETFRAEAAAEEWRARPEAKALDFSEYARQ